MLMRSNKKETAIHDSVTAWVIWLCACARYWPYRNVNRFLQMVYSVQLVLDLRVWSFEYVTLIFHPAVGNSVKERFRSLSNDKTEEQGGVICVKKTSAMQFSFHEQCHCDFCSFLVQTALNICLRTRFNSLRTPKGKCPLISFEGDRFLFGFFSEHKRRTVKKRLSCSIALEKSIVRYQVRK